MFNSFDLLYFIIVILFLIIIAAIDIWWSKRNEKIFITVFIKNNDNNKIVIEAANKYGISLYSHYDELNLCTQHNIIGEVNSRQVADFLKTLQLEFFKNGYQLNLYEDNVSQKQSTLVVYDLE